MAAQPISTGSAPRPAEATPPEQATTTATAAPAFNGPDCLNPTAHDSHRQQGWSCPHVGPCQHWDEP